MLRIAHYLTLAAGAALLAQPALASERQHRRHVAAAIKQEVAASPYYDAFGGYADAAAAASYAGPNARRYFSSAPDRHATPLPTGARNSQVLSRRRRAPMAYRPHWCIA